MEVRDGERDEKCLTASRALSRCLFGCWDFLETFSRFWFLEAAIESERTLEAHRWTVVDRNGVEW